MFLLGCSSQCYIIGGIVDRSVRSKRTLQLAKEHNIKAMRLPVQEYLPNRQTHVLNVDTVLKIIGLYTQYDGNWKRALEESVPLRKQNNKSKPNVAVESVGFENA